MIITGLAVGFIIIHVGIWRYYHCENRTGKTISAGIIIAGVLVIAGVFAIDAVNYTVPSNPVPAGTPQQ